jgi:probable rRNA maturation factor
LRKVFEIAGKDGEVSILFVGDREIRKLNREYRGIDRPTDVLSFALNEGEAPDPHPEMFGDIVISLDRTARQAEEAGHSFEWELVTLLVHGALHLLGYDHEGSEEDAARMKEMEEKVMNEIRSFNVGK